MDKLIIIFIICLTGCSLIGSSFGDVIEINSTRNKVEQDRTRMSSRDMTQVSAGLNYIWGVNQDMDIFMCKRPCTGDWNEMYGKLVQLDVDDHQVWGVNENDGIYVRPVDGSGRWKGIDGKLIHVSASGNGYIWGTNRDNYVYKCKKPCSGDWIRVDGRLKQIDGGQREVCGINRRNRIFCRPVDGSGEWRQVPGEANKVSASGHYDLFAIGTDDSMYRCRKPCIGQWIELRLTRRPISTCDATVDGLFAVDTSQSVWRQDLPL